MKILAIETSCDDTCISIIETKNNKAYFNVLSNIVSSQIEVHKQYGGVYPAMAKREHQKNIVLVLKQALKTAHLLKSLKQDIPEKKAKILKEILERETGLYKSLKSFFAKYKKPDIDLISITNGPGLEPCLWVGVNLAKALSFFWNIKIVSTNHIESHILVNYLENKEIKFPAICLVVSGGHTQLILMKKIGGYKVIGETRDDAAGECFDKSAKILGLSYPGGPVISKLAEKFVGCRASHKLPRPMINTKDYDFSFSGLKTAILYHHKKQDIKTQKSKEYIVEMCAQIQQAIIDVLLKKTIKAVKSYKAKTIILGGGVSANQELRKQLKEKIKKEIPNTDYLIPNTTLSTDNAVMTAINGYFKSKRNKKDTWQKLQANPNLRIE